MACVPRQLSSGYRSEIELRYLLFTCGGEHSIGFRSIYSMAEHTRMWTSALASTHPFSHQPPPEESPQCLSIVHDWPLVAGGQRGKYSTIGLTRFWSSLSFVVLSYPFRWIWCRGSQRTKSQMASR